MMTYIARMFAAFAAILFVMLAWGITNPDRNSAALSFASLGFCGLLCAIDAAAGRIASAIEARRAATAETGAVHESAVAKPDAQGSTHD